MRDSSDLLPHGGGGNPKQSRRNPKGCSSSVSPALGYCDLLSMVRSRPSCRDTRQHAAHELSRRFQPTHSNMQLTSDTDPCSRPEGSEPGRASSARLPATGAAHVTTRRGGPPGIALSRPTKRTLKLCQKGRDMFRPCHTSSTRRRTTVPAPPTRHTPHGASAALLDSAAPWRSPVGPRPLPASSRTVASGPVGDLAVCWRGDED